MVRVPLGGVDGNRRPPPRANKANQQQQQGRANQQQQQGRTAARDERQQRAQAAIDAKKKAAEAAQQANLEKARDRVREKGNTVPPGKPIPPKPPAGWRREDFAAGGAAPKAAGTAAPKAAGAAAPKATGAAAPKAAGAAPKPGARQAPKPAGAAPKPAGAARAGANGGRGAPPRRASSTPARAPAPPPPPMPPTLAQRVKAALMRVHERLQRGDVTGAREELSKGRALSAKEPRLVMAGLTEARWDELQAVVESMPDAAVQVLKHAHLEAREHRTTETSLTALPYSPFSAIGIHPQATGSSHTQHGQQARDPQKLQAPRPSAAPRQMRARVRDPCDDGAEQSPRDHHPPSRKRDGQVTNGVATHSHVQNVAFVCRRRGCWVCFCFGFAFSGVFTLHAASVNARAGFFRRRCQAF